MPQPKRSRVAESEDVDVTDAVNDAVNVAVNDAVNVAIKIQTS